MSLDDQAKTIKKILKDQTYVIAFIDPIEPEKVYSYIGEKLTDMESLYMIDTLNQLRQSNYRPEQNQEQ